MKFGAFELIWLQMIRSFRRKGQSKSEKERSPRGLFLHQGRRHVRCDPRQEAAFVTGVAIRPRAQPAYALTARHEKAPRLASVAKGENTGEAARRGPGAGPRNRQREQKSVRRFLERASAVIAFRSRPQDVS